MTNLNAEQRQQISEEIKSLADVMTHMSRELSETDNATYARHLEDSIIITQNDLDRLARKLGATPLVETATAGQTFTLCGQIEVAVNQTKNGNFFSKA